MLRGHIEWSRQADDQRFAQQVQENREIEQRRREYEEHEANRRELQRITAERDELAAYLRQRGERYTETAGEPPPRSVLEDWTRQFVEAKEGRMQQQREQLIDEGDPFA